MSQRLSAIYNTGAFNTDYNINSLISVRKVLFGADNIRMMIIRPLYSPTINKRCLLMTLGSGENFSSWAYSNRYAIDFALRGYVVAYFENAGSTNPNMNGTATTTTNYYKNKFNTYSTPPNSAPYNTKKDSFYTVMLTNYFISNEARRFVVANRATFQIDTMSLFVGGGSLGANASLFYTYGANNTFSYGLYGRVKNALSYTNNISRNGVRGVLSFGGGLPAPTESLGTIVDANDNIPAIFFSGAVDWAVHPNISNLLGPVMWGALGYNSTFQTLNIRKRINLNCFGTHAFETPCYNSSWISSMPVLTTITGMVYNTLLSNATVTSYRTTNATNLKYYEYTHTQSAQAMALTANYFNSVYTTVQPDALNYIRPTQIQNSIFYKYSIGQYTIEQAAISLQCTDGSLLCYFAGAHEYDGTTSNFTNATFTTLSSACGVLPNNYLSSFSSSNTNTSVMRKSNPYTDEVNLNYLNKDELMVKAPVELVGKTGKISIYNILGFEVSAPIYIDMVENNIVNIASTMYNLPNGIYICNLSSDNFQKSIKFNYVK